MSRTRLIALLLALVTLAVYLPAVRHGFINYDDGDYVTQNKMVQDGLTFAGIQWAFTTFHSANWHPLTWLSHMMDCELFGPSAAGPHFVNVLLHALNTVLLFALWLQLTRREPKASDSRPQPDVLWPAALVAALFALHPLHVESVAWVAERKDVLSTFFGLLALIGYAGYARSGGTRLTANYWLALFFFACGLMSKPMLVTLPFVMLLLDYWPLERWGAATIPKLFAEKIPFFLLTVISCIVTYMAQSHGDVGHIHGAVQPLTAVPLAYRLENVPVTITEYLLKLAWPEGLAVIYPMPHSIPLTEAAACTVILLFITAIAWLERRNPFLIVGWFWFLGTLVPVIGLVKVGDAAMADRYMYIPSIGIFVALAFGAQKIARHISPPQFILPATAILILSVLAGVTERQIQFWRDDETLFKHAMEATTNNLDAMINYGAALEYNGKPMEAIQQYERVEEIAPDFYMACADLGNLLFYTGQTNAALEQYQRAVEIEPNLRELRDGLGNVLAGMGHFTEATNEFYKAMQLDPASASPHFYLGIALARRGDFSAATNEFAEVTAMAPEDPTPLVEWSKALLEQGRDAEAVDKLHQALQLNPEDFQTLAFTAHVLAADKDPKIRDGKAALSYAQEADALTSSAQPIVQDVLGMAYAETGQFEEAQAAVTNAISLATTAGMKRETITAMQGRLELYQKQQPWRESFLNQPK